MDAGQQIELIRQAMGAAHVFCSAVDDVLDGALQEASEGALGQSHLRLLLLIGRSGRRFKVTDVAEFLGVTNAAASRAIERLVQRGLVERTISLEDRRAVNLALTPESDVLLDRYAELRDRALMRLLGDHSKEQLAETASMLDHLSAALLADRRGTHERCLRCGVHFRGTCVVRDVLGHECAARATAGA